MWEMTPIRISWLISAVVLVVATMLLGRVIRGRLLGVFIDSRGRYSLTHFQIVIWTLVILSLISGVFFGRWVAGVTDPLEFMIPTEILALMGISLGSTALATAVKASNDNQRSDSVAVSIDPDGMQRALGQGNADYAGGEIPEDWKPRLRQIFLLEEGAYADKVVDITKYQQFIITIVLVLAYIGSAFKAVGADPAAVMALPALGSTFLVLLGASHGAYIAGKLPKQAGNPDMTVALRDKKMQNNAERQQTERSAEKEPLPPEKASVAK
jgi:hypothetical protein